MLLRQFLIYLYPYVLVSFNAQSYKQQHFNYHRVKIKAVVVVMGNINVFTIFSLNLF